MVYREALPAAKIRQTLRGIFEGHFSDLIVMATEDTQLPRDRASITPELFQEICDAAVLAISEREFPADCLPSEVAGAVICEIHERVRRQTGTEYRGKARPHLAPNERHIREIVDLVTAHWTGFILVESTIREAANMVLEHWRHKHNLPTPETNEEPKGLMHTLFHFLREKKRER